jgi:hypothetical protein
MDLLGIIALLIALAAAALRWGHDSREAFAPDHSGRRNRPGRRRRDR